MKVLMALVAVVLVAACGVDGEPETPSAKSGVTISGEARVGVTYSG